MKTKKLFPVLLLFSACAGPSFAQTFDTSGDGQLNGNYYMRQVVYVPDSSGNITEAINVQGEINFNGSGSYSFTGNIVDCVGGSTCPSPKSLTATGTYAVASSGEAYMTAVLAGYSSTNYGNDQTIGLVSQNGVFIGSSTENASGYNDLFIAAPIASSPGGAPATNASLNGNYAVAYLDPTFTTSTVAGGDAFFNMSANGSGGIADFTATSYLGTNTTASTQSLTNVTYSFANGAAQLNFGGNPQTALVAGTEVLYITPDQNFVFGGSAVGFDMFVGVRTGASTPSNISGLYYQAGLDLNQFSSGSVLYSYFGSLQSVSPQSCSSQQPDCFIGHQRTNSLYYSGSSDYTYYDAFTTGGTSSNGDGTTISDAAFGQNYASSEDGTIRIGYGVAAPNASSSLLGINVAFQAPAFNGSGVYLSPVGVVNAASSAPFTAFLSQGEFLTLYGSGLASTTNVAPSLPLPNTLDSVQVLINQTPAPIYYVSPSQISVIVPFELSPGSIAEVQVINGNNKSNVVTQFTGSTSAGAFTYNPVGGSGIIAAERPDYSVISESNPAQIGDTISIYVAGMGAVTNQPADGAAASSTTLSNTENTPIIIIYDQNGSCPTDSSGNCAQLNIPFSGLAPGFAGLYQINVTVPSGLATGIGTIDILGQDSDNFEAILPIGTPTPTGAARPALQPRRARLGHPLAGRKTRVRSISAKRVVRGAVE